MFRDLEVLRELLVPTQYVAALWAVGFLLLVAAWCLWSSRRLGKLVDRIRTQDSALWQQLGSPQSWDELSNARNWSTLRRLRVDQAFAQQFDQRIVEKIRGLQRAITAALVNAHRLRLIGRLARSGSLRHGRHRAAAPLLSPDAASFAERNSRTAAAIACFFAASSTGGASGGRR